MCAISHGHMTRCMWGINQVFHAWTYRWPKQHGFPRLVPLGIVILCDQWHSLDDWACICVLVYALFEVLRVMTQTFLSGPGGICSIQVRGHLVGWYNSPLTYTVSPTLILGDDRFHLANCWTLMKYSCDQRCHRCCVRTLQRCQHCNDDMGLDGSATSGNAFKGRLIRKWPLSKPRPYLPVLANVSMAWKSNTLSPEPVLWLTPQKWGRHHQQHAENGVSGSLRLLPKIHQNVAHVQEIILNWMTLSTQNLLIVSSVWAFLRCV